MYPLDGEIAFTFFGTLDELAPEASSGGLRRKIDGNIYLFVRARTLDHAVLLQFVEQSSGSVYIVILEIDQGDPSVAERNVVFLSIFLYEVILYHPIYLAIQGERIAFDSGNAVLPHVKRSLVHL